jgi:hypothetical protein
MIRFLIVVFIMIVVSCKKENKVSTTAEHVNTFTAKVNGTPFIAKEIRAETNNFSVDGPLLIVSATNDSSQIISTLFYGYTATPISMVIDSAAQSSATGLYYEGRDGLYYTIEARSGHFSITSVDKNTYRNGTVVNGNFNFNITEGYYFKMPYAITEGKFSVFIKN